jgi:hypothetical protein
MLISGMQLTRSITSVLALSMLRPLALDQQLLWKRIITRQSEENVHETRDSKMVSWGLIRLRAASTVFAARPLALAEALIGKLLALETLAMSASSGPCLKGAAPSDAGPGQPA